MYLLKNITAEMKPTSAAVLFLFFIAIVVTAEKSYSYGWEWNNRIVRFTLSCPPNTGHPIKCQFKCHINKEE